jgi:Protein of unknown function (DUF2846)
MLRSLLPFVLLICIVLPLTGKSQNLTCSDIKNGVFAYFSRATGSVSTFTRNAETQKEFNPASHETILWDVEWVNDCSYFLKYNSGMEERPKDEQAIFKKHKILTQILQTTAAYYVFRTSLDKASNPTMLADTLWIKQRRDARNKLVANPGVDSILAIRKAVFDSTLSQSATLYAFRPGRFKESGATYDLFLNDQPICEMSNKAAYIVRLLKPGPATIYARYRKQEVSVSIDVKPGANFYLRCELPWTLTPTPKLTLVNKEEASTYFDKIK